MTTTPQHPDGLPVDDFTSTEVLVRSNSQDLWMKIF
jgi:hypothetical protein